MNKALFFKILSLFVFTVSGYFTALAQDSTSAPPAKPAPVVKHIKTGQFPPRQAPATLPGNAASQGATSAVSHTRPYGAYPAKQTPTARQPATPGTRAVEPVVANPNDKSLNGQYQYLLSRLYRNQQAVLAAFYKNIQDSLNIQRRKQNEAQAKVSALSDSLKKLQSTVSTKQASLSESVQKEDTINMLGLDVAKSTYNYIMWGLVILFGGVAAFVMLRSGINVREAKYRTKLYEELDEEYKNYKLKANEKEKKLARDLQTARNKLEEITGKPEY